MYPTSIKLIFFHGISQDGAHFLNKYHTTACTGLHGTSIKE